MVFIIKGHLTDVKKEVLRDILTSGNVQHAILFTDLSPDMHSIYEFGDNNEERSVFQFYEDILSSWMRTSVSSKSFFKC